MKLPVNYSELRIYERKKVREQYVLIQKGLCHFCKNSLANRPSEKVEKIPINNDLFPKGFLKYPIHLHHCHHSNMTIGAVHAKCNAVLWQYYGM